MEFFGIDLTELVGYIAMGIVLISFLMKDVKRLRVFNSIGCLLFVLYGCLLESFSWPIVITNTAIFVINIYYLTIKSINIFSLERKSKKRSFKVS